MPVYIRRIKRTSDLRSKTINHRRDMTPRQQYLILGHVWLAASAAASCAANSPLLGIMACYGILLLFLSSRRDQQ